MHLSRPQVAGGLIIPLFVVAAIIAPGIPARAEATATVPVVVELASAADTVPLEELGVAVAAAERLGTFAPGSYEDEAHHVRAHDLRRWHTIEVPADEVAQVLGELEEMPTVVRATAAKVYHTAALPNDPRFTEQYGLLSASTAWADINAPEAWEVTVGSGETVIAIVDGGVDLTHEDLAGKLWTNSDEVAGNSLDDDGNGFIDDVHGWNFYNNLPAGEYSNHATHVAGIAAAESNNGRGVAGINWQAKIMSVRVLSSNGAGFEDDIVRGIDYAVANGADIINLSLVGPSSPALLAAIENAYAAGVVVVAAAGNSGRDTTTSPQYPACADVNGVDMVIGVAATDDEAEPWSSSNYGSCVNIAAPGYQILSTKTNNHYGKMSGTSMSAPHVAGVAGLYLALRPHASPAEVINAINTSAESFAGADAAIWNTQYKGILNAARVVGGSGAATTEPAPQPAPAPQSGGGGGGGGEEPAPASIKKPTVLGAQSVKISAADRKAPDFIHNHTVPAVVARLFQEVHGRPILPIESTYWKLRARSDKATATKLRGAMQWQKLRGRTYDPKGLAGGVAPVSLSTAVPPALLTQVSFLFQQVFSRTATAAELNYWRGRVTRGEKTTITALTGAMQWQKLKGVAMGKTQARPALPVR